MTGIMMKMAERRAKKASAEKRREIYGNFAAVIGILCNLFLCLIKGAAGIIFNSVAILADAVNNLSDAGNSIITLIGFIISGKPADKEHPYGHARVEYLSCLAVSFIIMALGASLFKTSVLKIIHPEPVDKSLTAITILIIAILIKVWMALFYKKIGKEINSTVILANSRDSFNDVISTGAVLLTTLAAIFFDINLDAAAGCVVAVFIFCSGFGIMHETLDNLLGTMPSAELVSAIVDRLHSYEGVMGIHDLMVHSYGPDRYFATVHVEVPSDVNILTSHDMIDNIERDFLHDLGINLVIHLDPVVTDDEDVLKARNAVYDVVREIDRAFSMHDFRMVKGDTHSNLIFDVAVPAGTKKGNDEIINEISSGVKRIDESFYCVITVDRSCIPEQE